MAEGILDKLTFLIDGDATGVNNAMSQVEDTFKRGFDNILKNFVAPLTGALAAGRLFSGFTQQADKISKFSKSLGINGQDLQAWGEAATRAGGSAQAFQGSVRMLQRRIAMAGTGAGQGAAMFKKFGISLKDGEGKTKDAFQVLSELAAKADTMSKADFAGMAMSLRVDQGTIQLLQKGSKGVAELVDQMRELGTYTEEDYQAAEDYNDAMADFKQATQIAGARVFSALLPPINKLITAFAKIVAIVTKNKALLRGTAFAGMAMVIVSKVIPAMKKLQGVMTLKSFGTWAKLAALFTTLYLIVEDFVVWLRGGKSALQGFWETFGTQEEVRAKLEKLKNTAIEFFKSLEKYAPIIKKAAVAMMALGAVWTVISGVMKAISMFQAFAKAINLANSAMMAPGPMAAIMLLSAAIGYAITHWDELKAAAKACYDWIVNIWSGFSDWFKGIWNKAIDGVTSIIPDGIKKFFSGDKKNNATDIMDANASILPTKTAAAAAVAAIPPMAGGNNNTVNNDTEIRVQNAYFNSSNMDEMKEDVKKIAANKSGYDPLFVSAVNAQTGTVGR